jgi:predicted transcriptional regulator of viral defense system
LYKHKSKKSSKTGKKIQVLLKDKNGILLASDLAKRAIPRMYLTILERKGEIQRVVRGVYSAGDTLLMDEMVSLQSRYRNAVFSHETALYLWELADRSPLFYSVTVPSGYNATSLKTGGAKVYFIKPDLHPLGLTTGKSTHGNDIRTYDLERTVCDVVRSRNQMDIQFINEALKRYVTRKDKNIDLLYRYTAQWSKAAKDICQSRFIYNSSVSYKIFCPPMPRLSYWTMGNLTGLSSRLLCKRCHFSMSAAQPRIPNSTKMICFLFQRLDPAAR